MRRHALRRRALGAGLVNGALWSIGNGLTSGTIVVYLALELGARSEHIALVLAIPTLVGLLRLVTPALIARFGSAKRTCLAMYFAAYLVLLLLPAAVLAKDRLPLAPLAALVGLLCVHQLLEYIGTVALWAWFAEVVPSRLRGRYFARRQIWQLAVLVPTLWASGWWVDAWKRSHPDRPLVAYAALNLLGGVLLLGATAALVAMPARIGSPPPRESRTLSWRTLVAPLADARFRPLVAFGCWFSFFNGLVQSPQNIYPKAVLGLGLAPQAALRTTMLVGQAGVSAVVGRFSDRYGNRPVLVASQWIVAAAPLFFLAATPAEPYWLVGAYIAWSAYGGINVCLPNLMLKLADRQQRAASIACYFAASSVAYAASTVLGGFLFGWASRAWQTPSGEMDRRLYPAVFLLAAVTRALGVVWLARVREPGAASWRRIWSSRPQRGR